MADREGFRHEAGADKKLSVIRYGRDDMQIRELPNNTGGEVKPGEAVQVAADADDDPVFEYHDGNVETETYVVVEARGRGMDAQNSSDGYDDGGLMIAVNANGGGLNLRTKTGETITFDSTLVPEAGSGLFIETTTEGWSVAHADENKDLSGLSDPELVATEVA